MDGDRRLGGGELSRAGKVSMMDDFSTARDAGLLDLDLLDLFLDLDFLLLVGEVGCLGGG